MELKGLIRSGLAASAIVHLSAIAVMLVFAEVHPFGSVTAEPIAVDIVSTDDVKTPKPSEPAPIPKTSDSLDISAKPAAPSQPAPSQPAPSQPAPTQPTPSQQTSNPPAPAAPSAPATPSPAAPQKQASRSARQRSEPQPQQSQAQPQQQLQPAASPAYNPPEPDITSKYHVLLGLPPAEPQDRSGEAFDAPAVSAADVASSVVAEFRRHLKTCSKLPELVAPSDKVRIKLRVRMAPDGRLAAEPILIEASASAKGPALMQSAIQALEACQPYAMLPADRYGEWKVLDLTFTPQDFTGAS